MTKTRNQTTLENSEAINELSTVTHATDKHAGNILRILSTVIFDERETEKLAELIMLFYLQSLVDKNEVDDEAAELIGLYEGQNCCFCTPAN